MDTVDWTCDCGAEISFKIDAFKIIGKGVIVNVKSDEMYHAKKLEVYFDPETQRNMIIGRGAEHYSSLKHTEYVQNETDCRLVISQLNDEDDAIGISQLLNVVQVTIQKVMGYITSIQEEEEEEEQRCEYFVQTNSSGRGWGQRGRQKERKESIIQTIFN
eukprot:129345_1